MWKPGLQEATIYHCCCVLQAKGDSGLEFASGSHRDFALGFWRDHNRMDLSTRGYPLQPLGELAIDFASCCRIGD